MLDLGLLFDAVEYHDSLDWVRHQVLAFGRHQVYTRHGVSSSLIDPVLLQEKT